MSDSGVTSEDLEFGLLLPTEIDPGTAPRDRFTLIRELVRVARRGGFSSVWALHHYASNVPTLQPLLLLASLVDDAGDMTLGTAVVVVPLVHPVVLAEEATTLDIITDGRFVLGVGAGYYQAEFDALDTPLAGRGTRLEESVQVMRQLFRGQSVSLSGRHVAVQSVRLTLRPTRPGGPPIWFGGFSDAAIRRAARLADGWILPPDPDPRALRSRIGAYVDMRRQLRVPIGPIAVQRECLVAEDRNEARELGRRYLLQNAEVYAARGITEVRDKFDRWFDNSYLIGGTADVSDKIAQLRDLGVQQIHLRVGWGEAPPEVMLRTVELMGREVIPRFSHRGGRE